MSGGLLVKIRWRGLANIKCKNQGSLLRGSLPKKSWPKLISVKAWYNVLELKNNDKELIFVCDNENHLSN